jgi:CRISPR/Cas system-associated protein Cas10 (large subunit of type III CRISPR-Cas system)
MLSRFHEESSDIIRDCAHCHNLKFITDFHKSKRHNGGHDIICKSCNNIRTKKLYYKRKSQVRIVQKKYEQKIATLQRSDKILHSKYLVKAARHRAKIKNVPFDITYKDIQIPDTCPILGIKLVKNITYLKDNSASLDRIDPIKGYVKDNIIVISNRANKIKQDASVEELLKIAQFYQNLEQLKLEK